MSNWDDLQVKSEILAAIDAEQIRIPHNIPIPVYIQETENLYIWVLDDKEALTGAGLSWGQVEDLPVRIGALKEAEAAWNATRNTGPDAAAKWAQEHPEAFDLKKQILHAFRYAFRNRPDLLEALRQTSEGRTHAAMIQDLINLEVLGTANAALLEPVGFDMALLDKAGRMADELRRMYAESTKSRLRFPEAKTIRDRAYTHMKEAVDEICKCGRFVFKGNKERLHGYRSNYLRSRNINRRKKKTEKKEG
ncbi:MAG: hypothetical protein GY950_24700 [bacterium]|nr:hypothetical protein [bacterium]